VERLCNGDEDRNIFEVTPNKTLPLHSVDAPSVFLSLERFRPAARIPRRSHNSNSAFAAGGDVHRFEEVINGREYLIEVSSVGLGKYRAQIARVPGGSAALMPFYGKTPDEAAQHLSRWLALAHGQGVKSLIPSP
jgi:hypothetical protein